VRRPWRIGFRWFCCRENKANLAGEELEAKCLSSKGLREKVRTVRRWKTKPIGKEEGSRKQVPDRRRIVQNKANTPRGLVAYSQDIEDNAWRRHYERGADCAKQTQFARRGRVGRGHRGVGRGRFAKQTQFARRDGRPSSALRPRSSAGGRRLDGSADGYRLTAEPVGFVTCDTGIRHGKEKAWARELSYEYSGLPSWSCSC